MHPGHQDPDNMRVPAEKIIFIILRIITLLIVLGIMILLIFE